MRTVLGILFVFALSTPTIGCAEPNTRAFLVVVESSLHEPLRASLEQYVETMQLAQFEVQVEIWNSPGTVQELKALIFEQVDLHGVEGALLVGDLPAAWYSMPRAERPNEEFPTDLYLQDREERDWVDQDNDGVYDWHDDLEIEIYTSRLMGTQKELVDYFARLESYRRDGPLVDVSAFIFLDDDWSTKDTSDSFHLDELYSTVEIIQDKADSTVANYMGKLRGGGAEFVYQWVHAAPGMKDEPGWLAIDHVDTPQIKVTAKTIAGYHLKVSFVNMSNCYGARFTDEFSLAWAYTVGTGYGLAIIGSTKIGAPTDPRLFHRQLADGARWGEAYKTWFNEVGKTRYRWHLGIVLMGDPLLTVTGDLFPAGATEEIRWDSEEPLDTMAPCPIAEAEVGTFEAYRRAHPEFFTNYSAQRYSAQRKLCEELPPL